MGSLQYAAAGIGVVAELVMLTVCVLPYWSVSSWQISNPLYGRIPTFNGIWWQCMSLKTGGFTCNNYGAPSVYVPGGIQMCRALSVIAVVTVVASVSASMLTLDCTIALGEEHDRRKKLTARVAGIGHIIAGLCILVACSWFAAELTYQYYSPYYQEREFKYRYGACLYTGWICSALCFISALLLILASRSEEEATYQAKQDRYVYNPPVPVIEKEPKSEYV